MLATCICLNGSLLDQLSCTIVYLHNLFTCTFGRINMSVCLSVCRATKAARECRLPQAVDCVVQAVAYQPTVTTAAV